MGFAIFDNIDNRPLLGNDQGYRRDMQHIFTHPKIQRAFQCQSGEQRRVGIGQIDLHLDIAGENVRIGNNPDEPLEVFILFKLQAQFPSHKPRALEFF